MKHYENITTDVIGVGVGPFNLSLAALLSSVKTIRGCFFDRAESFSWHPGLLLPDAQIQVNHLQDLVTLVDPTNPYSFVSYLAKHKRLYRFIYAHFHLVLRREFDMYMAWVSRSLLDLYFNEPVQEIQWRDSGFIARTAKRNVTAKHLVLGSGLTPYVPESAQPFLGSTVFHSEHFLSKLPSRQSKRIVVVGGGQSGAEIVQHLLSDSKNLPAELTWVTRRSQFSPLDESPFANELFTPGYVKNFYGLHATDRAHLLQEQTLASDGISDHVLSEIYKRLYVLEFVEKRQNPMNFLMNHQLTAMNKINAGYELIFNANDRIINADIVILCTGYRWQFPEYLAPIKERIELENNRFKVNEDYSIVWDGPRQQRIYVQNAARHTHGIADPNLCMMAWRSAKIINSIAENTIYDIDNESTAINWDAFVRPMLRSAANA